MLTWILNGFLNWLLGLIGSGVKTIAKDADIDKKAKEAAEALKAAETKEERDEATKKALDGF